MLDIAHEVEACNLRLEEAGASERFEATRELIYDTGRNVWVLKMFGFRTLSDEGPYGLIGEEVFGYDDEGGAENVLVALKLFEDRIAIYTAMQQISARLLAEALLDDEGGQSGNDAAQ